MLTSIMLKTLRDARRSVFWWSFGLVALAAWMAVLYPSYESAAESFQSFFDEAPAAVTAFFGSIDVTTPEGFFNAELFSFMVPLLLTILAVTHGIRGIAGEERRGTLDLLMSFPVARRRVAAEKAGAMVLITMTAALVLAAALIVGVSAASLDLSVLRLTQASVAAGLLAVTFGAIAMALGCATGRTGLSAGVTSAFAVATFLIHGLGQVVGWLHPYRFASPFYYYAAGEPLLNGLDLAHTGVLLATTIVALAAGLVAFERRDLSV